MTSWLHLNAIVHYASSLSFIIKKKRLCINYFSRTCFVLSKFVTTVYNDAYIKKKLLLQESNLSLQLAQNYYSSLLP